MPERHKPPFIQISFFGGADEVTGSRHLLEVNGYKILLDCGLFQGHRGESLEKNQTFPFDPAQIDAVLLSHAHIDHSGGLPILTSKGFKKEIHCTGPTGELCGIMLMDSAHIQEEDAKFFNKINKDQGKSIEPLYTKEDVDQVLKLLRPHAYDEFFTLKEGIRVRFLNAGHVLGSAMVQLEIDTPKGKRRLLFTGDLGRRKSLIMTPPTLPPSDYLLIESTYGSRSHDPVDKVEKVFSDLIHRIIAIKGRILIPSFALERTQEIVYILEKLRRDNRIPPIHLYVDSPMAVDITEIFNRHLDCPCLSQKFRDYVLKSGNPFGFGTVRYVRTVEESKKLNELEGEKVILSASGMCEGGRILHHLRNNIDKDNCIILLVGYQANGTLGRRLADGNKKVKIFGLEHQVIAQVEILDHFSSHADRDDLLWYLKNLDPRPQTIFLVHGDEKERTALAESLETEGINRVERPKMGDTFELA